MTDTTPPEPNDPSTLSRSQRNLLAHPKLWIAVGAAMVLVGVGMTSVVLAISGATTKEAVLPSGFGAGLNMAAGESDVISCAGAQLHTAAASNTGMMLTCDPTATTVPPPTTVPPTTAPATTVPATSVPPTTTGTTIPATSSACRFASAPAGTGAALCQTFDAPASPPTVGRSPALASLWGVSRMFGNTNTGQGQLNAAIPTPDPCGGGSVSPPNDVKVCNGRLQESVTDGIGFDNGTVTSLAMYPKQAFDFAGRTGTISFDVSDDSAGNHRAWPELWVTDSPAPDPFTHFSSWQATPKDGFGIRFAGCGQSGPVMGVDSAVVVNNYVSNDSFAGDFPNGSIRVSTLGCMTKSSGVGNMNHIEVRVSANQIDVYGTNAGNVNGPLIHLSTITGFNLSLTRGIVWLEDVHYNGNKDTATGPDAQGTHTFSWDNVGFDGPVLPKDLAFDASDRNAPAPNGWMNMGYGVPANIAVPNVVIPPGTTTAALLFNYSAGARVPVSYSVNAGAVQTYAGNYPLCYQPAGQASQCSNRTAKVPVPVGDLVNGTNVVHFSGAGIDFVANVDILLPGAGG